jgi:hypothetical protein
VAGGSSERVAEPDEREVLVMEMEMGEKKWRNREMEKWKKVESFENC